MTMMKNEVEWPKELREANTLAIPQKSKDILNKREQWRYASFRRRLFEWMITEGKEPKKGNGYAVTSLSEHSSRLDTFLRWLWDHEGMFTTRVTMDHADSYLEDVLRVSDYSGGHKRKTTDTLKILFKYQNRDDYGEHDWDPIINFRDSRGNGPRKFTDWLREEEISLIKSAALSYGAVPSQSSMSADDIDFWKGQLAQRFGKSKDDVCEEDWMRANSYKIPSLVSVSLDVAFRPCEVQRSRKGWFRLETKEMVVPKRESSKNKENWDCVLSDESVELLKLWFEERKMYSEYQDEDGNDVPEVWLTREGNPYSAGSLRDLMRRLFEEAGMETAGRELGWYLIRRGVGTIIGQEGLHPVMDQLRIKNVETARRYVKTSEDTRRQVVNSY